jgi:Ca2+-binding RTX toxin-like protein
VLHGVVTDGNDELSGSAGDDVLNGGLGIDTLAGGDGDDTYVIDGANDLVVEAADAGHDLVKLGFAAVATYALTANVEDATITSTAAVNLTGNLLDNLLTGNAAANILLGGDGNDTLSGGAGNDSLVGGNGQDYLDGGAGSDTLQGGADNNTYVVDAAGDKIVDGHTDDIDNVLTSLAGYTLAADLSNLKYSGTAAFTGTGNAVANLIEGGAGNDVLKGLAGNDTLIGGAGNDQLTGGADADVFVLTSLTGSDTVADFLSGTDLLKVLLPVGNGDSAIDGGLVRASAGGFTTDAELVLFTQKMATATTANAAAVIGSANGNYAIGDTALFAVSTAGATVLYRFQAGNADAVVSAGELTQLVTLTGTPSTTLADYSLASYLG